MRNGGLLPLDVVAKIILWVLSVALAYGAVRIDVAKLQTDMDWVKKTLTDIHAELKADRP